MILLTAKMKECQSLTRIFQPMEIKGLEDGVTVFSLQQGMN